MAQVSKKSSPNGDTDKRLQQVERGHARMDAEKLGWKTAAKLQIAVIAIVLSVVGGVFGIVYTEMQRVKDDITEVKIEVAVLSERQVRMEDDLGDLKKDVRMLLELNVAQQSGDTAAIDAAYRDILDRLNETDSNATSDATPHLRRDTPSNTLSDAGDATSSRTRTTSYPTPRDRSRVLSDIAFEELGENGFVSKTTRQALTNDMINEYNTEALVRGLGVTISEEARRFHIDNGISIKARRFMHDMLVQDKIFSHEISDQEYRILIDTFNDIPAPAPSNTDAASPASSGAGDTPAKINVDAGGGACYTTPNTPTNTNPTET